MKRIGWLCGIMSAVIVCAGIVRAQGQDASGGSEKGGMRGEIKGYFVQQQQENSAFRNELEGMTNLDEKISAIIDHRNQQYGENKTAISKMHDDIMAKIKDKMSKNSRLSTAEKTEVTNFLDQQYQENVTFLDGIHNEIITFLKGLEANQSGAKGSVKDEIKNFMAQEKEKVKQHHETQEADRKAFRQKLAGEIKANKGTSSGSSTGSTSTQQ